MASRHLYGKVCEHILVLMYTYIWLREIKTFLTDEPWVEKLKRQALMLQDTCNPSPYHEKRKSPKVMY